MTTIKITEQTPTKKEFVVGRYYIGKEKTKHKGVIVMCTSLVYGATDFEGVEVYNKQSSYDIGYSKEFNREAFTEFSGIIEIEQTVTI